MQTYLCTLADARREAKADVGANLTLPATFPAAEEQDVYVFSVIPSISQRMCKLAGREFEPYRYVVPLDVRLDLAGRSGGLIKLPKPLLELTGATYAGETLDLPDDLAVYGTWGDKPARFLQITPRCGHYFANRCVEKPTLTLTGWWGWRTDYAASGWEAIGEVQVGGISATTTTLTVVNINGLNPDGVPPRYSPGQLLRIDDEMLRVLATDKDANTITVRRGERGSMAAAHTASAAIRTWQPEPDVRRVVERWAGLESSQRASYTTVSIEGLGRITGPADILPEVIHVAQTYANL